MTDQSTRRTRVPRNSLSAELILDTALRLLDEGGIEAFSMRALAEELGVGTMALYTYFRGRDEIFRAARERVFAEHAPPPPSDEPWEEQLRAQCVALYTLLTGRPSVLQLLAEQHRAEERADQQMTHGAVVVAEHMLCLLRAAGLGREEAARAQTAMVRYTVGAAMQSRAGCADQESRRRLRARLESLPAGAYPVVVDLAPELAAAQDGAEQYAFGLDLIIRGLRDFPAA